MRKYMHGVWVTEARSDDGAVLQVADHGAHLLSWTTAEGDQALYLSGRSGYGGDLAIRGGVPIIFPQFAERGAGRRHGFARTAGWRLAFAGVERGRAVVRHVLTYADLPGNAWPHRFELRYEVAAHGNRLHTTLSVANPSPLAWSFHAALHSYWRVADIASVGVTGLCDVAYIDQVAEGGEAMQRDEILRIDGEVDRIYRNLPGDIGLDDGERTFAFEHRGFPDAVVWNPGAAKAAALSDLTPGGHREFLCIEAGAVMRPVTLAPGETWEGSQVARVERRRFNGAA